MFRTGSAWQHLISRAKNEKHLLIPATLAWLNGLLHRYKFRVQGKNIRIGRAFRVYGKMVVRGPGRVVIGDNCYVDGITFRHVCLSAALPKAEIEVGNNCGFNGTVIQCYQRVSIGDWSNIADAYITDTPAHSLHRNRRQIASKDTPSFPVTIGRNVWVSARVVILHGVSVGENSVIGACSLVRKDVPPDVFAAGNPLRIIKGVEEGG